MIQEEETRAFRNMVLFTSITNTYVKVVWKDTLEPFQELNSNTTYKYIHLKMVDGKVTWL